MTAIPQQEISVTYVINQIGCGYSIPSQPNLAVKKKYILSVCWVTSFLFLQLFCPEC